MARNNNNLVVSEARAALYKFKMESAREAGVNLKDSYNGDLTAGEAGTVGGNMVKAYEQSLK
ncbi:alpha/beta-type small acid-soluble spore protein [Clostridium kluyveri]|uniref:Small, acid-soluble spore protein, alpha/beta type n=1 Tax=Clostridium kluyveri TaxID=1534 RepID=A0A1L5FBC6_CLOKL|nr:alpha/beta-type small acid-soluble spore protein [Clostridium kluyveri]APM40120.1 small, acid-soluble spore protein, alpha/beta type [Clostridium kluyveri]UZQ49641.1 alpha/beta-type small acid-soluble spore protein [Clostridium kluyveri]